MNTLARYSDGRWTEYGAASGLPAEPVWGMLFARDGAQWVVTNSTVLLRPAGAANFRPTGIAVAPRASLAEGPGGGIWVSDAGRTRLIARENGRPLGSQPAFFAHPDRIGGTRMLFDRDGNLWQTSWNSGVLRIRSPDQPATPRGIDPGQPVAAFDAAAGLTSDQMHALFQDREGNIWIGTELGLDMLRPAPISVEPGIPANSPSSYRMAATRDGTVYVADATALYAIRPGASPARVMAIGTAAEALCADRADGVWLVVGDRIYHVEGASHATVPKPPGVTALGCVQDGKERLWLPALDHGLFWREDGMWHQWPGLTPDRGLPANAALTGAGEAAILFRTTPPEWPDVPFATLSPARSRVGGIEGLLPGRTAVFVSGAKGLEAPLTSGTGILSAAQYPWAASLNGLAQTAAGDTWAIGDSGIVRLRSSDLDRALHQPGGAVPYRLFDFRDGLNSFAQKAPGAQIVAGGDGRIWFLTRRNVMRIDPAALTMNHLAPTVIIRSLRADGRPVDLTSDPRLPAGTSTVQFGYTATSLTVPQRVRFRYRLTGFDDRWIDPGGQRSATFSGLGPGAYVFQVIAANEDGVWNQTGRTLAFTIDRAFYQTWWFRIIAAAVISLVLYLIYVARVRYLGGLIRERLAERTLERERIARELHDTLIQGVQGLIMRFQAVADRLAHDKQAQAILLPALDRAEEMLVEGRDRVKGLRRLDQRHLHRELEHLIESQAFDGPVDLSLTGRGAARLIAPDIVDDIVAIVGEALCNAARHAQPGRIEIHVEYGARAIELSVKDDGVGIAPDRLSPAAQPGHYGLLGMRERARRIKGKLTIESAPGAGTTVRLTIPARLAYAN